MKTYWWKARRNFGDALNPYLLKHFAGISAKWAPPAKAELVCIGSVLDILPSDWEGAIVGSGKLYDATVVDFPFAKILALRGNLTAKNAYGICNGIVIGDPALLASDMVNVQTEYDLGVVPHWSDDTLIERFSKWNPRIIRPDAHPLEVISEIGRCKKIVSSSLHGIIIADAFGIPRRAELFPRAIKEGGEFKFHDYASSIGMKMEFGKIQVPNRAVIENKQSELFDLFTQLPSLL